MTIPQQVFRGLNNAGMSAESLSVCEVKSWIVGFNSIIPGFDNPGMSAEGPSVCKVEGCKTGYTGMRITLRPVARAHRPQDLPWSEA